MSNRHTVNESGGENPKDTYCSPGERVMNSNRVGDGGLKLPRSGECRSVAEDDERRLVMTGSVCLDKFTVDTDLLSASKNRSYSMVYSTEMNGGRRWRAAGSP